jgi:hypothetical protein
MNQKIEFYGKIVLLKIFSRGFIKSTREAHQLRSHMRDRKCRYQQGDIFGIENQV